MRNKQVVCGMCVGGQLWFLALCSFPQGIQVQLHTRLERRREVQNGWDLQDPGLAGSECWGQEGLGSAGVNQRLCSLGGRGETI